MSLSPERWARVKAVFDAVVALDATQRAAFLDRECGGDAALRQQVKSLLESHERAPDFLETPAAVLFDGSAAADDLIGRTIGPYRLVERIGAGGMGEVYRAEDARLNRPVALKLLPQRLATDEDRLRRFHAEARAASSLNHPQIIVIHDFGEVEGRPFIVTEFVEGQTLRERMQVGAIAAREAVEIAIQVAGALAAAHARGLVHRDIKPENVMLRPDGYVKVLDFGLAKLMTPATTATLSDTNPGTVMGTPRYMSPEQARGLEVDARTDIWSLGVMLYEMLAGRPPFDGPTPSDVMAAVLGSDPVLSASGLGHVPAIVTAVLEQALAKEPGLRYASAADMHKALTAARASLESGVVPAMASPWRRPTLVVGLALGATLIVVLAGYGRMTLSRLTGFEGSVQSIAVLPFRPLGAEVEPQLGIGLADVLATRFGTLESITVVPTGTAMQFQGKEPQAAGRALGIDAVLDGSIQKADGRYRVTVQLLRVSTGSVLWAGSFDEPAQNLLALQDGVATAITGLLVPRLQARERARMAARSTTQPEAWRAYLDGRALWALRTPDGIAESIKKFDSAIALDSSFALAYTGLAQALLAQGGFQLRWPTEVYPRARLAAIRAIELDGSLADAHGVLADVAWTFDRDWATAEQEFRRALALNPNDSTLHMWHAGFRMAFGHTSEALADADRALALDPLGFAPNYEKGRMLVYAGRCEEAIQHFTRMMTIPGGVVYSLIQSSYCHDLLGHLEEAKADLEKARQIVGDIPIVRIFTAGFAGREGRREEALAMIHAVEQERHNSYVEAVFIAGAYLRLGDVDNAMRWLRQTVADRSLYASYLAVDPTYAGVHDDPRFQEVLRSAGLAEAIR